MTRLRKLRDAIFFHGKASYAVTAAAELTAQGDILCVFKRSRNWVKEGLERYHLEEGVTPRSTEVFFHNVPEGQIVLMRSSDRGQTWTRPKDLYPEPYSQITPRLTRLRDGTLLCTFYRWHVFEKEPDPSEPFLLWTKEWGVWQKNLGIVVLRSGDDGETWEGPFPVSVPEVPGNNSSRARIVESPNGALLLAVCGEAKAPPSGRSDAIWPEEHRQYVLQSTDKGETWHFLSALPGWPGARYRLHEAFLFRTVSGRLSCFLRCDGRGYLHGTLFTGESNDDGRTWSELKMHTPWGQPWDALQLQSGNVLLLCSYRRPRFGIRARLLDAECANIDDAEEVVLRADGGSADLGYPSPVQFDDGEILVTYWHNLGGDTRFIAGTYLVEE